MKLAEISKSEAARYMGVKGEPDARTAELLDKYEPIVREKLRPAFVYRESNAEFTDEYTMICGIKFTGSDIREHLKGCDRAILLAATVSAEADKLIRQLSVGDMAAALTVDALCSAAIEQVCDRAEEEIFASVDARYRTWRFSPGYGDLPIAHQRDLLNALNAQRRIGLTLTDSCLLLPSKSVTAIIGLSEVQPTSSKKGCEVCSLRDSCNFRLNGSSCKNK